MLNRVPQSEPQQQDDRTDRSQLKRDNITNHFDPIEELDKLFDIIANSPRVPMLGLTMIDEEQVLDRLDSIKNNLPEVLRQAWQLIDREREIVEDAQNYAKEIVTEAEQSATKILSETDLVRQAEAEAARVKMEVQQECDRLKQQTLEEIEQMRQQTRQEVQQWRELAKIECEGIQNGADDYADVVLDNLEGQLSQMLETIRRGRQELR
jgi:cell division septum initiation protein DivIVA